MDAQRAMKISALVDGEIEEHEVADAMRASLDDVERWRLYCLIGDSLRGDPVPRRDLTPAVMARLAQAPIVLAPRRLREGRPRPHPLLALAASMAGVAVVAWVALSGTPQPADGAAKLAAVSPVIPPRGSGARPQGDAAHKLGAGGAAQPAAPTPAARTPQGFSPEMQEYLLAHQAQATTLHLAEAARQIRTVSLTASQP